MDLKACKAFLTIIDAGSMNKAAAELGLAQPTLSRQLARLEEEVGVHLFERQAKSLRLTREGLLFSRRCREMLELEKKALVEVRNFDEILQGDLVIGCGEYGGTAVMVSLAARFQKIHPDVRIQFITGDSSQIREMIEHGIADIGLFLEPINLETLKTIVWKQREPFGVVIPACHPLADFKSVTPEDLLPFPLLLPWRTEVQNQLLDWFGCDIKDLNWSGSASLASTGALMALDGIGIPVTCINAAAYHRPDLRTIPLDPPFSSCLSLAWKEQFPKPQILTRFLEFINSHSLTCACVSQTECRQSEDISNTLHQ